MFFRDFSFKKSIKGSKLPQIIKIRSYLCSSDLKLWENDIQLIILTIIFFSDEFQDSRQSASVHEGKGGFFPSIGCY